MNTKGDREVKHRDLNWLSFNDRVLQEAADKKYNPLYERLKFLAIYSSNLDEYFRVRVSQLRQMKRVEKSLRKKLALKPSKTVKAILQRVEESQDRFGELFRNEIIPELKENGIHLLSTDDFSEKQLETAHQFYEEHLKEAVEPELINLNKPSRPFIKNQALYFCVTFEDPDYLGFVNVPTEEDGRFVTLGKNGKNHFIAFVDEVLRQQVHTFFRKQKIKGIYAIKLSRDAELYLDDELDGILAERIYSSLSQRQKGQPTRLLYDAKMPKTEAKKLRKLLGLGKIDMMPGGHYHNFNDFFSFPDPTNNPDLHYEELPPIPHKILEGCDDYFEKIKEKDQMVHFPYMSFSYVECFVKQAAEDDQVDQIKISLYRIAETSALTSALLLALENGKAVTIFIEAKARFDESNNIKWGRKFEEKGARVIYSYPRIKVHSKILLINRKEKGKDRKYAYIATGNFNGQTSKIYADHGLFTAHKKIAKELGRVFEVLEGDLIVPRNKHLLISPFTTRRNIEKYINHEIEQAQKGNVARIDAKMNSLEDYDIVQLLYKAGAAGVKIRLLVRGFTTLIPQKKGLSENIKMTSIVDRYLEHGRIYKFHNSGDEKLFMGSADWMTRNLDRRIEVLTPIYDEDLFQELADILTIQMNDNIKARIQDDDESNSYVKRKEGQPAVRSQYAIYDYLKKKHTL